MAAEIDRTMVPAYLDGKVGYIDAATKKFVIPPKYDDAAFFADGVAIVTLSGGGMAVIDNEGNVLLGGYSKIMPAYEKGNRNPDRYDQSKGIHSRVFVVEKNGKTGIYNIDSGWIVPADSYISEIWFVDRDTLYYDGNLILKGEKIPLPKGYKAVDFDSALGLVWIEDKKERLQGGKGVIRLDGSIFIKPEYNDLERADSGYWLGSAFTSSGLRMMRLQYFMNPSGNHVKTDVISPEGKVIRSFKSRYVPDIIDANTYSYYTGEDDKYYADIATGNDVIREKITGGKYILFGAGDGKGVKDAAGNVLLKPEYGDIKHLEDDIFAVSNDSILGKWGMVSVSGGELVPYKYDRIDRASYPGVYLMKTKEGYGLIDSAGRVLYKPAAENAFYFDEFGYARLYKDGKSGMIDAKGNEITPFIYRSFNRPAENVAKPVYTAEKDGLWGAVGMDGETVIPFEYGYIADYSTPPDWYRTENKDRTRYGVVNTVTGVNLAPEYEGVRPYENVIVIYSRHKGEASPRASFIDFNGKIIAEYTSITQTQSSPRFFIVEQKGRYGLADEYGKLVVPCKYKNIDEVDPVYFKTVNEEGGIVYIDRDGTEYLGEGEESPPQAQASHIFNVLLI